MPNLVSCSVDPGVGIGRGFYISEIDNDRSFIINCNHHSSAHPPFPCPRPKTDCEINTVTCPCCSYCVIIPVSSTNWFLIKLHVCSKTKWFCTMLLDSRLSLLLSTCLVVCPRSGPGPIPKKIQNSPKSNPEKCRDRDSGSGSAQSRLFPGFGIGIDNPAILSIGWSSRRILLAICQYYRLHRSIGAP